MFAGLKHSEILKNVDNFDTPDFVDITTPENTAGRDFCTRSIIYGEIRNSTSDWQSLHALRCAEDLLQWVTPYDRSLNDFPVPEKMEAPNSF